jgi:hypothetical protein
MKAPILIAFGLGVLLSVLATMSPKIAAHVRALLQTGAANQSAGGAAATPLAHTEKQFEFVANAPMSVVAPLFGAWKEREWAPGWDPKFVWPAPASVQAAAPSAATAQSSAPSGAQLPTVSLDREGMVFTVKHGHTHAAWVNTAFDLANGKIQYAYVVPDAMVTLITLRLTPEGARTRVHVEYDRTALDADLNAHVLQMADADGNAGPEWEQQVNDCLKESAASRQR